ncbi:MAG: HAMP domain-containing histidine kinase [Clostridium sp.]|nr:HAMP domain-containing histidine kinase [Clostridium sp.]
MKRKSSLKIRLAISYVFIIILTLTITDLALGSVLRSYFNQNVRDTLENQLLLSVSTYERYYSDNSLESNVANDEDAFWRETSALVQIIDVEGRVLLDSSGFRPDEILMSEDVVLALQGKKGSMIFSNRDSTEKLMAVSMPLRKDNQVSGVLRFTSSLRGVNQTMDNINLNLFLFGIGVVVITTLVSYVLSLRFTRPIDRLTKTAEIMASGNFNVVSVKMHDDEIGKLSDTLNYMSQEIKKKEQLKNDFISSVSHELRTPLTSIKGWALTIKDPQTDQELLDQGLEIISNESDRLKGMVDELLDFSKFVSGNISLNKEQVDISKLFTFIQIHMDSRATQENKNLVVEKSKDMGALYGDVNRLKQVLINLMDNAFKFTEKNDTITLKMEGTKNHVSFIVEDTGMGINDEEISKVKEKFYKGKTSRSTNGIGLSICDEITKLHGGTLTIESQVEEGTKVTVYLPRKDDTYEKSQK